MLTAFTLAAAIIIGGVISLATNSWWFLVIAVGIHVVVSTIMLRFVFKATNQGDKPDPVTEAHVEAGDQPGTRGAGALTKSGTRKDREVVL
jgi:membrane protein implicated in regulation of membrane protease activity